MRMPSNGFWGRASCLAIAALAALAAAPGARAQTNVLLVVADDLGVDSLGVYQEGTDPPVTPVIDSLVSSGVLFRNVWSNPNCSPTRAGMMTGRYSFRTGIGDIIPWAVAPALPRSETTLPELLGAAPTPYATGAFGKWHLGNETVGGFLAPNEAGFDYFAGTYKASLEPPPNWVNYFWFPRVVNGVKTIANTYITDFTANEALAWIQAQTGPWFCYMAFHAPHGPFHKPPPALYYEDLTGLDPTQYPRPHYKAAIEALDTKLGHVLAGLGPQLANTLVIFVGDNGTPVEGVIPPFSPAHSKGSLYEGGINVPLIVSGPQVTQPQSECQALVSTVDLYATIAEVAGVDLAQAQPYAKLDSVSLVPYLADPSTPSVRSHVFSERFQPNGVPTSVTLPSATPTSETRPKTRFVTRSIARGAVYARNPTAVRAVRDARYKLVFSDTNAEFYDLQDDPFEQTDLLASGLNAQELAAYDSIVAYARGLLLDR